MDNSSSRMSCILRLHPSPGWHKTLTKLLKQVKDVSYTIDTAQEFAYISGDVDTALLLKLIAKSGKHAELYQLDYGYSNSWNDYYSQKHQNQSSQDQTAAKSLQNSAPAAAANSSAQTRGGKTKRNYCCCLM